MRGRLAALGPLKLGLTVGLTLLWVTGWLAIPRWLVGAPHTLPVTALEARLPFVEGLVYAYLSIVLFMPLAPYLTVSRSVLLRHGAGFAGLTLAAFASFVLYPITMPMPPDAGRTALFALLLQDTRLNNLPSLHAGYTVYSWLYWQQVLPDLPDARARRATALLVSAWAGVILISVLLTKQHYLLDVVAGAAAGALAYGLAFRVRPVARLPRLVALHPTAEAQR
jgi:membrane-associated phospholipid phosphatase